MVIPDLDQICIGWILRARIRASGLLSTKDGGSWCQEEEESTGGVGVGGELWKGSIGKVKRGEVGLGDCKEEEEEDDGAAKEGGEVGCEDGTDTVVFGIRIGIWPRIDGVELNVVVWEEFCGQGPTKEDKLEWGESWNQAANGKGVVPVDCFESEEEVDSWNGKESSSRWHDETDTLF